MLLVDTFSQPLLFCLPDPNVRRPSHCILLGELIMEYCLSRSRCFHGGREIYTVSIARRAGPAATEYGLGTVSEPITKNGFLVQCSAALFVPYRE